MLQWRQKSLCAATRTRCSQMRCLVVWLIFSKGTLRLIFIVACINSLGFPGGSDGEESTCNAGDLDSTPGQEDPLEKWMATHSSILAWRIPWTGEPDRLQLMESQRAGHDWATMHTLICCISHNYRNCFCGNQWAEDPKPRMRQQPWLIPWLQSTRTWAEDTPKPCCAQTPYP